MEELVGELTDEAAERMLSCFDAHLQTERDRAGGESADGILSRFDAYLQRGKDALQAKKNRRAVVVDELWRWVRANAAFPIPPDDRQVASASYSLAPFVAAMSGKYNLGETPVWSYIRDTLLRACLEMTEPACGRVFDVSFSLGPFGPTHHAYLFTVFVRERRENAAAIERGQ